jgi:hypothetical protein
MTGHFSLAYQPMNKMGWHTSTSVEGESEIYIYFLCTVKPRFIVFVGGPEKKTMVAGKR